MTNWAHSTVATAPSPPTTGTTLVVASGEGSRFPSANFLLTVFPADTMPNDSNAELVLCTSRTGDTLTITRQQEGSGARTIVAGDRVYAGLTQGMWDTALKAANDLSDVDDAATARGNLGVNGVEVLTGVASETTNGSGILTLTITGANGRTPTTTIAMQTSAGTASLMRRSTQSAGQATFAVHRIDTGALLTSTSVTFQWIATFPMGS